MKQIQFIMGMPVTVEICDEDVQTDLLKKVFQYFSEIDQRFSLYKKNSEINQINRGELKENEYSQEMKLVFELAEQTRKESFGFFDQYNKKTKIIDPSGIVKGWAIYEASKILSEHGVKNFYIEAGGDIQVSGKNKQGKLWRVGIRNPFETSEIVKVIEVSNQGVATSGNYERGQHIYNPQTMTPANEIASITVIGLQIYDADRFATAAFAMGKEGINFIEKKQFLEGYMIDHNGTATMTTGFQDFVVKK